MFCFANSLLALWSWMIASCYEPHMNISHDHDAMALVCTPTTLCVMVMFFFANSLPSLWSWMIASCNEPHMNISHDHDAKALVCTPTILSKTNKIQDSGHIYMDESWETHEQFFRKQKNNIPGFMSHIWMSHVIDVTNMQQLIDESESFKSRTSLYGVATVSRLLN